MSEPARYVKAVLIGMGAASAVLSAGCILAVPFLLLRNQPEFFSILYAFLLVGGFFGALIVWVSE